MKTVLAFLFIISTALGCFAEDTDAAVRELSDKTFLNNTVRYLYRWYLDEADIEATSDVATLEFKIRRLTPQLDQGDKSLFGEVRIPLWKIAVRMKKADYKIEELDKEVKSNGFKVVNVSRVSPESEEPQDLTSIKIDLKEMKAYLFKTRNQPEYPNEELIARLRKEFRNEIDELSKKYGDKIDLSAGGADEFSLYLAPLSPVSNEIWAYRDRGHVLIRCSSDIDITNPAVWKNERIFFHLYDTYNQMVLSLGEAAGNNEYMTRNQIGRALYNCMVLGKKISLQRNIE